MPTPSRRLTPTRRGLVTVLTAVLIALSGFTARAADTRLMVFAAASTTNLLTELGQAFGGQAGVKVINSFASSSTLAKQIEQGAPADVYVSANVKWMDYLEKAGAIVPGSRFNLLRNRLVLIAPAASPLQPTDINRDLPLASLLGDGRLALGDPGHVPAGIYAKQALTSLGFWPQVEQKVAGAANVRVALALVETGEAPLGVVYATDAAISRKVKVLGTFPEQSHRPIVYPAAVVKDHDSPLARSYLAFLRSPAAAAICRKYGFMPY